MNSGSLISSRLNLNVFPFLAVLAAIIVLILFALYIMPKITARIEESSYSEKNRNKPTTSKNIQRTAKNLKLTKDEKKILSAVFLKNPVPNIRFAVKNAEIFEQYLKEAYFNYREKEDEESIGLLFELRKKIYKNGEISKILKHSRNIPVGTIFTYTPSQGIHYKLKLSQSLPMEFALEFPKEISSEDKPASLSKISFKIIHTDSSAYSIETRVLRYQDGKSGETLLICPQTDKVTPLQKRTSPRIELGGKCAFYPAKKEVGRKNKVTFSKIEKRHLGILKDASAGGCQIATDIPIKAEQYLYIEALFDGITPAAAYGKILRTTKKRNSEYNLHIKFERIELRTKNRINAAACHYE